VSIKVFEVIQDQKYQGVQAFAMMQSILDVQGLKVNSLMGRVKKAMTLASGSAGECQIDL
jgi:hypothetical protein